MDIEQRLEAEGPLDDGLETQAEPTEDAVLIKPSWAGARSEYMQEREFEESGTEPFPSPIAAVVKNQ
jgi:hypothetical protein